MDTQELFRNTCLVDIYSENKFASMNLVVSMTPLTRKDRDVYLGDSFSYDSIKGFAHGLVHVPIGLHRLDETTTRVKVPFDANITRRLEFKSNIWITVFEVNDSYINFL